MLIVILSTGLIFADDSTVTLTFRPLNEIGQPVTEVKGPAGEPAIEVVGGQAPTMRRVRLFAIILPSRAHNYVVRGRVKYEGVIGDGYLEMWNDFGEKGQYFSPHVGQLWKR